MRLFTKAFLPRFSMRLNSTIILLLAMPFLNMKNRTRTMFHSFFATTGVLGSISIACDCVRVESLFVLF